MKKYQVFSGLLALAIALVACPTPEVKPPTLFDLNVALSKLVFRPNSSASLPVSVQRLAGFTGDITVGLNTGTLGFSAVPITIKSSDTSGTLQILTAAAPGSTNTIGIQASSGASLVSKNTVGQVLPFTTTLFDSNLVIAAGTSVTTKVLLGRSQGYSDPVTVTLTGLPTGVLSSGVTIPANTTSGDLFLTASKTAPATTASVPLTLTTSSGVFEETWSATITVIIKPGSVIDALNRSANSVTSNAGVATLLQPDGKFVAFGTFTDESALPVVTQTMTLTRWNPDATLDTTFGTGGTTSIISSGNSVTSIQQNGNGDYLISSRNEVSGFFKLTLWRINSAGVPVLGFGTNGKLVIEDPSMSKNFFSAVLLPNAKIIIIGEGNFIVDSATGTSLGVSSAMYQKLNADGTPDTAFGTNGTLLSSIQSVTTSTRVNKKGKILSDGSLLVYNCDSNECTFFRIDPVTGAPNASFSYQYFSIPNPGKGVVEVLEYNNKIHLVIMDFGIIRLNTNGTIDDTYSPRMRGVFNGTFGTDGSLVLLGAGASDIQTASNDAAIQRFTPDGQPDLSFGTAGRATIPREGSDFNLIARHGTINGNTLTVHGVIANSGFTQFNYFNARVKY
jgi:uncharacterized delta-60 repeat protein